MHPFLRYAEEHREEIINEIRELVEIESPTGSDGVASVQERAAAQTRDLAEAQYYREGPTQSLRLDFQLPGEKTKGRILGLGHADTVWPTGTLATMPFRVSDGRLWGPGTLDMKAGLTFFAWAARMLRDLKVNVTRPVSLLIVGDEETGSKYSRQLTESEASRSELVLVLEPGTGLSGKLKTARKGIARYRLKVRGVAAHAGVDFQNGASAIEELAHQITQISKLSDFGRGSTVNVGVIGGGTASNVVAAEAYAEIDVRMWQAGEANEIDRVLTSLTPANSRCRLEVSGGLNRPPMERTAAVAALFQKAQAVAADLGLPIEESSTGGGSDGNFTAALGVPTLDGLGAIGEGAHALNESLLTDCIAKRVALLGALLAEL